jgi:NAD(P)H-hydrate epimerase
LSALDPIKKPRNSQTEKRQQGRVLIVGGSQSMPGAVIMNTAAALQAGSGLVTTCLPQSVRARAAVAYPEAMWNGLNTNTSGVIQPPQNLNKLFKQKDVLLIGSGMSEKSAATIKKIISKFSAEIILDADALGPNLLKTVSGKKNCILLPHAGEFKRLSGKKMSAESGRAFASKTKTVIVLKGPMTMITDGTHLIYVPMGGPILARGGSGDCLAGIIAAVVARRRTLKLSLLEAVECGVVWHARAADLLRQEEGEEAVRATQLLSELSKALK